MSKRFVVATVVLNVVALCGQVFAQSTTYVFDLRGPAVRFFTCPVDDLADQTVLLDPPDYQTFALDFNSDGTSIHAIDRLDFGIDGVSPRLVGTIDPVTGLFSSTANLGGAFNPAETETGLSIDPTDETLYLSTATTLYTLDPSSGAATVVGTFNIGGTPLQIVIDIAVNSAGDMYAHDIGDDMLYLIDKSSGDAMLIGPSGLAGNFAQGMDFDPATDILYAGIYTGGGTGSYGTWDTTSGVFTEITSLITLPDQVEPELTIQAKAVDCLLGDVNLDGSVNLLDVTPFVDLVTAGTFQCEADVNEDGAVNLLDVNPFVGLLGG